MNSTRRLTKGKRRSHACSQGSQSSPQIDLVVNEISLLDVDLIYIKGFGGDEKQPYRTIIRADIINQFIIFKL